MNKRIVILGAGESGAGAAVLAKKEGLDVFVSDMSKIADKYKQMLNDRHIEWEGSAYGRENFECRRDHQESWHTRYGTDGEKST